MPSKSSKKRKKLPRFSSDEDLARFVETEDLGDYLDSLEEQDKVLDLSPALQEKIRKRAEERFKKRLLTLRLENRQIEDAKRIAKQKGLGYQTLLRLWIQEGIEREAIRRKKSGTDG